MNWTSLKKYVTDLPATIDVGVGVIAPAGETWSHQGDKQFPSASTVKVPIMVELYRMIDRGDIALADIHEVKEEEHSAGSGVLSHMAAGLPLRLGDLLYLMMSLSDNTATNILLDIAGMEAINSTMASLGMSRSRLSRPMRGRLAIAGELENLATPNDYTRALQAIFERRAASRDACDAMVQLLAKQQNSKRIGRYVPVAAGFTWGSKTGTNRGIVNDVGFVSSPTGTLLIAVFCSGAADEADGEATVAQVARLAMRVTGMV